MIFLDFQNFIQGSSKKTISLKICPPEVIFVLLRPWRKIRFLVREKNEIEYGDESKSLAPMEHSDNRNSEARITMNDYLNEHNIRSFKISIETLLKEIKHVVTKKYEFDFR